MSSLHRSWKLCLALAGALVVCAAGPAQAADTDLASLVKNLNAQDAKDRAAAIDGLADMGADAKPAVSALVGTLGDKSADVRWRAARALGAIGDDNRAVSAALTAALKDESPLVRAYAASALGRLEDTRPDVAEAMAGMLTDEDAMVRRAALRSLRQMKLPREVSIPLFVKTLTHADQMGMMAAIQTIAESGEKAVPFLVDALGQPRAAYWAALTLAEMGPLAKPAVPGLARLLSSNEPETRLQACMALGAIGADAQSALPALVKILGSDPLPGVRYAAAFAIGGIRVRDEAAIAALRKAGQSNDKFLRIVAAAALARILPDDKAEVTAAVKLLIDGLKSDSVQLRQASARALQELKSASDIVGPALISALKDSDPMVQHDSLVAIASMGPVMLPQLTTLLKDKDLRRSAAAVLATFGPAAKPAVGELVALLDDPNLDAPTRRELQFTLGQIGPDAAPAVPELIQGLASDQERVRNSAIFALGRIGPAAKAAIPALTQLETSEDPMMRVGSLWALVHIQPGDSAVVAKAVPELVKSLDSERQMVRAEVARTLASLGAAAKPALPALEKVARQDPDPQVRDTAAKAIEQIQKSASGT